MEIGAVLIGAALALAAGFYLAKPVIEMDQVSTTRGDRELSSLLATRDHILDIIHELDMDHSLGKIPTEDYQAERYSLVKQGAFILREIDSLTAGGAGEEPAWRFAEDDDHELREAIERAVLDLREGAEGETRSYCTQCGKLVARGDQFCTHCGRPLKTEAAAQ